MFQTLGKKSKTVICIALVVILVLISFITSLLLKEKNVNKVDLYSGELARAMEYTKVNDGDEKTNCDYVKFDAFFLRDFTGNGEAEGVRGTCKQIGKEDVLYMEFNVLSDGVLQDRKNRNTK